MFICNHCPFVKHLKKDIAKVTSFYMEVRTWKNWHNVLLFCLCLWWPLDTMQKGLGAVAISSNSIRTHPQVRSYNWWMPYLVSVIFLTSSFSVSKHMNAKNFVVACSIIFRLLMQDLTMIVLSEKKIHTVNYSISSNVWWHSFHVLSHITQWLLFSDRGSTSHNKLLCWVPFLIFF